MIVSPAKNKSLNLSDAEPRLYASFVSGIKCPAIVVAPKVLFVKVWVAVFCVTLEPITKSNVPSPSSYVTVIPVSVFDVTIPPTTS